MCWALVHATTPVSFRKMFPWKGLPSNVEATDSKTAASLLDPSCGIPPDVHFEIEDSEGTSLGILGGHRTIMALKSPVFKAMFFGPMKEEGDLIRIRDSSMFAFQAMLKYIHDAKEKWGPWEVDFKEVLHIANLVQRYNLPGLERKIVSYAINFLYPEDKLMEIASLAEQFHMYEDVSEALLANCANYLTTTIETPEDLNNFVKKWSEMEVPLKDVAFRLLAKVDFANMAFVGDTPDQIQQQEISSHLRNIDLVIQPRHRMQKLKTLLEESSPVDFKKVMDCIDKHGRVFIKSLQMCQKKDAEKAAQEGLPLKLDTLVEDRFTHEASVRLHLDMLVLTRSGKGAGGRIDAGCLWDEMLDSVPEVMPIFLDWFCENPNIWRKDTQRYIRGELVICAVKIGKLPGYDKAREVYDL